MTTCACGNAQATGRYCAQCGAELATADQTATVVRGRRPGDFDPDATAFATPRVPPPAAFDGRSNARFPLYADETATLRPPDYPTPGAGPSQAWPDPAGPTMAGGPPPPSYAVPPSPPPPPPTKRSRTGLVVGLLLLALIAAAIGGGFLLLRDRHDQSAADDPGPARTEPRDVPVSRDSVPAKGDPGELASSATVVAAKTAPPGVDLANRPVSFDADQMLDGDPTTCWRMPGDGTGQTLQITLPEETRLSEVGLINGYAKTGQDKGLQVDWYDRNRRITSVTWTFDDGTTVSQSFQETTKIQPVRVDTATTTIQLTLETVTPPARGGAGRDYTAISELSLTGSPA